MIQDMDQILNMMKKTIQSNIKNKKHQMELTILIILL